MDKQACNRQRLLVNEVFETSFEFIANKKESFSHRVFEASRITSTIVRRVNAPIVYIICSGNRDKRGII